MRFCFSVRVGLGMFFGVEAHVQLLTSGKVAGIFPLSVFWSFPVWIVFWKLMGVASKQP